MKTKIAIIGGGIAGLTAGYLHEKYDVTLFEKSERIGAYTLTTPDGQEVDLKSILQLKRALEKRRPC